MGRNEHGGYERPYTQGRYMTPSFVDKVRSNPPTDRRWVSVIGADPDIHTMGFGSVGGIIGGALPMQILYVRLFAIENKVPKKTKQHAIMDKMCRLLQPSHFALMTMASPSYLVVESQDFYPDRDMPRNEMVAKANALISIATVTGRVLAMGMESRCDAVRSVTPSEWKGNRKKPADHARSAKIVVGAEISIRDEHSTGFTHPDTLEDLPALYEHALDGLGMALYGMEALHRGTWK